jgi:hypothetical protein
MSCDTGQADSPRLQMQKEQHIIGHQSPVVRKNTFRRYATSFSKLYSWMQATENRFRVDTVALPQHVPRGIGRNSKLGSVPGFQVLTPSADDHD